MPSPDSASQDVFRIAIVGGGIGGLFAALCIHHHHSLISGARPIHIDIYEQASAYKEIGAGVGIGINAARLVHRLGLGEKLNAIAGKRNGVWITFRRFDDGEEIVTLPVKDDEVVRQAPCARSDFLELLKNAVEERKAARLQVRKECVNVEVSTLSSASLHYTERVFTAAAGPQR
jgi:salicylate hydroxylase